MIKECTTAAQMIEERKFTHFLLVLEILERCVSRCLVRLEYPADALLLGSVGHHLSVVCV